MAPLATKSNWLTIEGIGLLVLGALAIIFPFFTGLAFGVFLGWLLIVVGILGIGSAIAGRDHAHLGWSVASAVVAIICGLLLAFHPLFAALAITLIVAAYLLIDGVALVALGLDQRKRGAARWHWVFGAGGGGHPAGRADPDPRRRRLGHPGGRDHRHRPDHRRRKPAGGAPLRRDRAALGGAYPADRLIAGPSLKARAAA